MPTAPAASRAKIESTRASHHRQGRIIRRFLRNGFTACFVLSPAIGSVATVANGTSRRLDIGIEISGPHDFAVRVCITRQLTASASIASRT
jgi:hypothetical protein